jgi:hypothetical protein
MASTVVSDYTSGVREDVEGLFNSHVGGKLDETQTIAAPLNLGRHDAHQHISQGSRRPRLKGAGAFTLYEDKRTVVGRGGDPGDVAAQCAYV